jgi:hypothetical protein
MKHLINIVEASFFDFDREMENLPVDKQGVQKLLQISKQYDLYGGIDDEAENNLRGWLDNNDPKVLSQYNKLYSEVRKDATTSNIWKLAKFIIDDGVKFVKKRGFAEVAPGETLFWITAAVDAITTNIWRIKTDDDAKNKLLTKLYDTLMKLNGGKKLPVNLDGRITAMREKFWKAQTEHNNRLQQTNAWIEEILMHRYLILGNYHTTHWQVKWIDLNEFNVTNEKELNEIYDKYNFGPEGTELKGDTIRDALFGFATRSGDMPSVKANSGYIYTKKELNDGNLVPMIGFTDEVPKELYYYSDYDNKFYGPFEVRNKEKGVFNIYHTLWG